MAQEYGGGAFTILDKTIIFSNYKDQRLYKQVIGGEFQFFIKLCSGAVNVKSQLFATLMQLGFLCGLGICIFLYIPFCVNGPSDLWIF